MDPLMLERYSPLSVGGDGNCLYRALSLALFGTEDYHGYLRVRTAIEISSNECLYNPNSSTFVMHDLPILTLAYTELVRGTLVNGTYSEMMQIQKDRWSTCTTNADTDIETPESSTRTSSAGATASPLRRHSRPSTSAVEALRQQTSLKFFRDASRIYSPAAE